MRVLENVLATFLQCLQRQFQNVYPLGVPCADSGMPSASLFALRAAAAAVFAALHAAHAGRQ